MSLSRVLSDAGEEGRERGEARGRRITGETLLIGHERTPLSSEKLRSTDFRFICPSTALTDAGLKACCFAGLRFLQGDLALPRLCKNQAQDASFTGKGKLLLISAAELDNVSRDHKEVSSKPGSIFTYYVTDK